MLWAAGVIDMGIPADLFWSLTMPLFVRLWDRHRAREKMLDRRAGTIAVAIYNVNRDTTKYPKAWDWTDVFTEHKPPPKPMTEDEMIKAMDMMVARTAHRK